MTNNASIILFALGAIAMTESIIGALFLRFYRRTSDRFFLYFAASFWIDALARCCSALRFGNEESVPMYALRILAFGLIIVAIVDKNIPGSRR